MPEGERAVWESDSEGDGGRDKLLREFAGKYGADTESFRSQFL